MKISVTKSRIYSRPNKRKKLDKSATSRPMKRMKVDKSAAPTKLIQKPPSSDENRRVSFPNKWKSNIPKDDDKMGYSLNSAGHKTSRIPIINILPTDNITLVTDF